MVIQSAWISVPLTTLTKFFFHEFLVFITSQYIWRRQGNLFALEGESQMRGHRFKLAGWMANTNVETSHKGWQI